MELNLDLFSIQIPLYMALEISLLVLLGLR